MPVSDKPRKKRRNQSEKEPSGKKGWDELKTLNNQCRVMLTEITPIISVLKNKEYLKTVKDKQSLVDDSKILLKDLNEYHDNLNAIYQQHSDKSGDCTNPDDLMASISLGEQYFNWMNSFRVVVLPTVERINTNYLVGKENSESKE